MTASLAHDFACPLYTNRPCHVLGSPEADSETRTRVNVYLGGDPRYHQQGNREMGSKDQARSPCGNSGAFPLGAPGEQPRRGG